MISTYKAHHARIVQMAESYVDFFIRRLRDVLAANVNPAWTTAHLEALVLYFHNEVDADVDAFRLNELMNFPRMDELSSGERKLLAWWLGVECGVCGQQPSWKQADVLATRSAPPPYLYVGSKATHTNATCAHGDSRKKWDERQKAQAVVLPDDERIDRQGLHNTDASCVFVAIYHVFHKTPLLALLLPELAQDINTAMHHGIFNLDNDTCRLPPRELAAKYFELTKTGLTSSVKSGGILFVFFMQSILALSPALAANLFEKPPATFESASEVWKTQALFNSVVTSLSSWGAKRYMWSGIYCAPRPVPMVNNLQSLGASCIQFGRIVWYLGDLEYIGIIAGLIHLTWVRDRKPVKHYVSFVRSADNVVSFYNWGKITKLASLRYILSRVKNDPRLENRNKISKAAAESIGLFLTNQTGPFEIQYVHFFWDRTKCPTSEGWDPTLVLTHDQVKQIATVLVKINSYLGSDSEQEKLKTMLKTLTKADTVLIQWFLTRVPTNFPKWYPAWIYRPFNPHWIQPTETASNLEIDSQAMAVCSLQGLNPRFNPHDPENFEPAFVDDFDGPRLIAAYIPCIFPKCWTTQHHNGYCKDHDPDPHKNKRAKTAAFFDLTL
jgi:hypothetical protein